MLSTSKQEGTKSFKPLWGQQDQEIYTIHKMSCHQSTLSPEMRPTVLLLSHSHSGCSLRVLVTTTGKASSLTPNSILKSALKNHFSVEHDACRVLLQREVAAGWHEAPVSPTKAQHAATHTWLALVATRLCS